MTESTICMRDEEIHHLLNGETGTDRTVELEQHLANCNDCRQRLEHQVGNDGWWDETESSLRSAIDASGRKPSGDAPYETRVSLRRDASILDLLGPTDDPNMLGRIGPYEIFGLLGQGGMGAVFKGFDRSLNRFVAIKMLLPHLATSGASRKRFAREGQAVAAVVDDHVMAIHCVDEWQGIPYLVMTYSRGVSLQKRLSDNGALEVREILRIGMQAAKGLAAAHGQGIVHRDIKPANIFLDQNVERVQLMDFGLARAVDDASLTRSGTLAGTPQYMSPEQARAENLDHLSDLFSLGSVLYAMCTGHAPFRAESSYSVLRLITDKDPRPIREVNPDVPEWLCAIIGKLMAKQAEHRFASANEVAELLEDCLAHVQQPTTTPLPAPVAKLVKSIDRHPSDVPAERLTGIRVPPVGKLITAAAFVFSLILAAVVIVLELNKGTLTIESDADDVPIRIMQGAEVVDTITVSKSGASTRIAAGEYVVEIDGEADGVHIDAGAITLSRGGVEIVNILKTSEKLRSEFGEMQDIREMEEFAQDVSEMEELSEMKEVSGWGELAQAEVPPPELTPSEQAFAELEAESSTLQSAYDEAWEDAADEVELNRVYQEMDPRQIMPPKYLAMEEKYRGTDEGLKALVKVCGMARSVGGENSPAGIGRREAVTRMIEHYLQREGLESVIATLDGGPFVPQADELLQALVDTSPFRKTQAEAMIAQIIQGKETLMVESQLPRIRVAVQDRLAQAPPPVREEFEQRIKTLEKTDFKQLRRDLNKKLKRLAELYSDVSVAHYGTGGTAAHRLSHAINKVIIGHPAPELAGTDIDGKPFRLSELRGKTVVLMFAQSTSDDYGDMYGPMRQLVAKYRWAPVRVVGIMSNAKQSHIHAAEKRGDMNWMVIPQPLNGPLQLDWGIEGYPTVYIVDAEGTLLPPLNMPYYGEGGYDTNEVSDALDKLLETKKVSVTGKHTEGSADAAMDSQTKPVDYVRGKTNLANGDLIEIQSVTTTGSGLEVGAKVTVKGTYTLNSMDAAVLGFFSTQLPGEKPTPTPIQPSQHTSATRGKHAFTLSKIIGRIGSPHVTFYHPTTGKGFGGVYFSESEEVAESLGTRSVDFVLGNSNLGNGDQIEIQSVTTSGSGLEVGATVTVKGTYTLNSEDAALLGFFSTQLPGETPTPTPIRPSQQMKAKKGKHTFTLSKILTRIGSPHVSFYHATTGKGMGGVYFSEQKEGGTR